MNELVNISRKEDIIKEYKQTPISLLFEYHNFEKKHTDYKNAQLIIGTCIDFRIKINIPPKFAFTIRSGGANMANDEFFLSFAIATGKIKHVALIGHNNCGMSNLKDHKEDYIHGLAKTAGISRIQAEKQFLKLSPKHEIGKEEDFILREAKRLKKLYPQIQIAPLMYLTGDSKLYFIKD